MSNHETPDGDPPASLDDPDWVDRIVAKAMESAEKAKASPALAEEVPSPPAGSRETDRREIEPASGEVSQAVVTPDPVVGDTDVPAPAPVSVFDQDEDDLDSPLPVEPDDADAKQARRNRALVEWIAVIAGAIVVAFLVKTFLVQAFYIPSSSMEPTLQINDRVLVNKLSYDFGDISRGDLVVFERPSNLVSDTDDLIKRVIGLPGETIELIDGRVYINGRGLNEPYVGDLPTDWLGFDDVARELCGGDDICTIPEGYVFVMGDNRTGSTDSRRFGPISENSIVGRAFLRIWPLNDIGWL